MHRHFATLLASASLIASGLLAAGCTAASPTHSPPNPAQHLGMTVGWLHGSCLGIRNSKVPANSRLLVVRLDDHQSVVLAKVLGRTNSGKECNGLLDDRKAVNLDSGVSFYRITTKKPIELGIGVLTSASISRRELETIRSAGLDVNGDGRPDVFAECSTAEGVHFSVWDGTPYKSTQLWSGDYYLGYDTESNCPQ